LAESGIPIRVGCHFGERAALGGVRLARQLLQLSEEDSVTVTGTVIDLIDLPVYTHRSLGSFELSRRSPPQPAGLRGPRL